MTLTANQENAKALAALLGIDETEAARRLTLRIAVTFDDTAPVSRDLGNHVIALLSRTVEYAGTPNESLFDVEILIGPRPPAVDATARVYVGQDGRNFIVDSGRALGSCDPETPRPFLVVAACHIAAAAIRVALGTNSPLGNAGPIVLCWEDLFPPLPLSGAGSVDIGTTYLAGAGAVGHGFIYALRYFDVRGKLRIADPKTITPGGLNRCLLLKPSDVGHPKATRLCQLAKPLFSNLELIPIDTTLGDALKADGTNARVERLVVGVDSRRARRSLQMELPRSVFDASTTGVSEIVLHFNRQPSDLACLSCVYPETERERAHEENVAEALGLSASEVRAGFITTAAANSICGKYPDLRTEDLIGRAFDTVYKELCGVGKLTNVAGEQVLAPFSFVSVLAGAHLAIEFVLRVSGACEERFNYWRVSPWHSPVTDLRQTRSRDEACEFCNKTYFRAAMKKIWGIEDRIALSTRQK
jgi:molybdopterin/thiamine biosynthesis adenylyltransferase